MRSTAFFTCLTLCCVMFSIGNAQKIGINKSGPIAPLDVSQLAGTTLNGGQAVANIEYTGTNAHDVIAIKAKSRPLDYYGIGGLFEGGYIGVKAVVSPTGSASYTGVLADVTGGSGIKTGFNSYVSGSGTKYGLNSSVTGAGTNYGVYATASGGTTNWAGYFASGNVYIKNQLGIGQANPQYPVHINQPSGTTLSGGDPVLFVEYTGVNNDDVTAIKGRCVTAVGKGVGGFFQGGLVGVHGYVSANGGFANYGVHGEVHGSADGNNYGVYGYVEGYGTNYGVYGLAWGPGTNWAGYFVGRVYTADKLGVGRTPATNMLEVEGNASKSSAGDWVANSDARLKRNIQELDCDEMLRKLLSLKGITYEWNDDKTGSVRPEGTQYGFTAQNIQDVFPTLVEEDALGYLQTAYGTYDAMMVESIRALQQQRRDVTQTPFTPRHHL